MVYKLGYRQGWYRPLAKSLILSLGGELGHGNGYGHTGSLPFFENYYAGGTHSVRGFRGNTLGPRDVVTNNPIGGNSKILGHVELLFPGPFEGTERTLRLGAFIDAGNVFASRKDISFDELRSSYGFSSVWLTPVGALSFNWAWALNSKPGDETEVFQFTIGAPF